MTTLLGLIKLLGIAEQHYTPPALGCSEDVGERHLTSFVHKQHIDSVQSCWVGPQPSGSAYDVGLLIGQTGQGRSICGNPLNTRRSFIGLGPILDGRWCYSTAS